MNKELKPYDEYKETDLSWLDKVPKHWEIKPNRVLWNERKTINCISEQLLSVTIKKGIISQAELLQSSSKKDSSNVDKSKYKLVAPNDIVYNKMRMWQGAVGVSNDRGIVSPAYIVLKPRGDINHRYYHFLLRTPGYIEESHRNSYGICDDQLSLRYEDFKGMQNIIPPKDEQDQIVRYLDSKLSKANKFINTKKKQIELLQELKQAIINKAVTKGLAPTAKMKPSGIEWLGDIPEGWEVKPMKYFAKIRNGKNFTFAKNGMVPVYGSGGKFSTTNLVLYDKPSVLLGRKGTIDKPILVEEPFWSVDTSFYTEIGENIDVRYFYYICCNIDFGYYVYGTALPSMTQTILNSIKLPCPLLSEQQEIVRYIETKTLSIDNAIEAIKKEIDLISEYRTSLISDVVTGKVDVRHVEVEETFEEVEQDFNDLEEYAGEELVEKEDEVYVN